jgi:signal transduction histidine kinase
MAVRGLGGGSVADEQSGVSPAAGAESARGGRLSSRRVAVLDRLADLGIALPGTRRRRQENLIASLNQVASAISSTMRSDEVLRTVVDETKLLVGTEKAVLCLLADSGPELRIDERAVFVRGQRSQYPEEWWRARIHQVAGETMERNVPLVEDVDGAWLVTVPVKIKNRPVGVLAAINPRSRRFWEDQISLMAILGAFAGTAIENARLHEQSSYALLADERGRIAKEMHDGLSQQLFSVSLELDVCRKRLSTRPEEVERRLERQQAVVTRSLGELRRYIYDLRPVSLDKLGLVGAVEMRSAEIAEANGFASRVYVDGDRRGLPPGAEAAVYRIAQEALNNVARHAQAKHVLVVLRYRPSTFELVVEDDGIGFSADDVAVRTQADEGIGLRSMRDRAAAEGGTLSIHSDDRGTTVNVVLPC